MSPGEANSGFRVWHWVSLPVELFCYTIWIFKYWQEDSNIYISTRSGIVYSWLLLLCFFFVVVVVATLWVFNPTWFHLLSLDRERREREIFESNFFLVSYLSTITNKPQPTISYLIFGESNIYMPSENSQNSKCYTIKKISAAGKTTPPL